MRALRFITLVSLCFFAAAQSLWPVAACACPSAPIHMQQESADMPDCPMHAKKQTSDECCEQCSCTHGLTGKMLEMDNAPLVHSAVSGAVLFEPARGSDNPPGVFETPPKRS